METHPLSSGNGSSGFHFKEKFGWCTRWRFYGIVQAGKSPPPANSQRSIPLTAFAVHCFPCCPVVVTRNLETSRPDQIIPTSCSLQPDMALDIHLCECSLPSLVYCWRIQERPLKEAPAPPDRVSFLVPGRVYHSSRHDHYYHCEHLEWFFHHYTILHNIDSDRVTFLSC